MKLSSIKGILLEELYITKHSFEIFVDIFIMPLINIIVFGYVSLFLSGSANRIGGEYLLLGMLLWQIVWVVQYSLSTDTMWNIWSRNLTNIFITPMTTIEYFVSLMIASVIKAIVLFIPLSIACAFFFHLEVFRLGMGNIVLFFINLMIFSWAFGISVLSLIFRFGTKVQALAWSLIFVIQPLTASFFPVSVLPSALRPVAYIFPPTYIFEAARAGLTNPAVQWQLIGTSFIENLIWFGCSILLFRYMFRKSKESGQFSRNEG